MGLAFPSAIFQELGVIFDESLSTTEDWDYLQRVAMLAGVSDIRKVTGIYRWWDNAESSKTMHSKKEWDDNYDQIQRKMRSCITIFPEEGTGQLLKLFNCNSILKNNIEYNNDVEFLKNLHFKYVINVINMYLKKKIKKVIMKIM